MDTNLAFGDFFIIFEQFQKSKSMCNTELRKHALVILGLKLGQFQNLGG
jgi:hypothetical protein